MSENNLSRPFIKSGNPLKPKPVFYNVDPIVITKNNLLDRSSVYKQDDYENLKKKFNDIKLVEKYGENPSRKELKQFNEYLNSDSYLNEFNTYVLNESKKYFDSLDEFNKNLLDKLKKYYPKYETESVYIDPVTYWDNKRIEHMGEGKTSDDVKKLQEKLGLLNISGYFDDETINAVKEFLKKNNLPVTGIWDEQTQTAYDALLEKNTNSRLMQEYFNVNGPSPLIKHSHIENHPLFKHYTPTAYTIPGISLTSVVLIPTAIPMTSAYLENTPTNTQNSNKSQYNLNHEYVPVSRAEKIMQWKETHPMVHPSDKNYEKWVKEYDEFISTLKRGGKMNKIKYFQWGKNLPTAPDAKEAYKGGTYKSGKKSDKIIGPLEKHYVPRQITRTISSDSDTTYVETPKYFVPEGEFIRVKSRKASSSDKDRTEYEILNRRFNEAASVSKKQQGGQMQQQDILQQIIQLVQAAMQGDQQATQTIQQVMLAAEQGDQQAQQIAQMIQQVAEQMKGLATMAKLGSKLGYIKSLKYAKGGKTCKNEKGNNLKKVKKCQTGEVIESNSPNLNYVQNGDYWYEQDGNGIIYNDTYSDAPGTLTREVETGNMINDPNSKRTYYTIFGPNKNYGFVTRQGRQDRRRARNEITGGRNEITDFEQKYNNGQDITRRQLRDDAFLKDLSKIQYNNSNDADLAANVVYPQRRDIELGNLEVERKWGRKKVFGPHIHDSACGHKELHLFDTKYGNKIGLKWNSGHNRVHNNRVKSNIEYDQMPEMKTQYAVPVQTTVEEVTETRPISNSRTTSTPNPPIEVVTPVRRTNRSATRPATRSTPVESKPIITRVPQPDTTNTTSNDTSWVKTNSVLRFPNGQSIVLKQGEWEEK